MAVAGLVIACAGLASAQQTLPKPAAHLTVTIDSRQTAEPTSKYEFGMFIEHIGPLVYRSLWSEMLDDRKFYLPVTAAEPQVQMTRQGGGFPGRQLRKWSPVGAGDAVTMDKSQPFVGAQSPHIALEGSTPHGILQSGLSVVKSKQYVGHIWLKGTSGSTVKVALIWGKGAGDREMASFAHLTSTYTKYPFRFTAKADSSNAALEIAGTGTGNFHVGTVSLMPAADNVDGFRPDTIALLRQLHSGMWRLPGGNFLSDWSWYDGVGPRDKRPSTYDYAWNAMQSNDVGLDEFMTLCRLIGVEPYITVNAGFGDAHSAAEEVEYMNGSGSTRLGAERTRNGHPEPYHVKYWDIGNEPYGVWQLGRTDLKYYVLKHNEFAAAMRKVDPSIILLASGNMPEPMDLTGEMRAKDVDNMKAVEGTPVDWTGGEIEHSWGNFSGITQHWYAQPGQRFNVEKAKHLPLDAPTDAGYDKVEQTPLEFARYPANIVHLYAQTWRRYQQRFPQLEKNQFSSPSTSTHISAGLQSGSGPEDGARLRHDSQRNAAAYGFPPHVGAYHGRFHHGLHADSGGIQHHRACVQGLRGQLRSRFNPSHADGQLAPTGAEVSHRRRSARNKLRQPDVSARHVRRADARPQAPDDRRGQCNQYRTEVRPGCHRSATEGTADIVADHRQRLAGVRSSRAGATSRKLQRRR